jgi:hypothetical protein
MQSSDSSFGPGLVDGFAVVVGIGLAGTAIAAARLAGRPWSCRMT